MGEQIIETSFEYTKKNLKEIQKVLHRKTAKKLLWVGFAGLALLIAAMILQKFELGYFGVFWLVFCFVMRNSHARKFARKTVKFNQKHYGTTVKTHIRFYPTMLAAENEQTGSQRKAALSEVVRVIETKHHFALVLPDNICVMADRRSIDREQDAILYERLHDKCTSAEFVD